MTTMWRSWKLDDEVYVFSAEGDLSLVDRETLGLLIQQQLERSVTYGNPRLGDSNVGGAEQPPG